MTATLDVAHVPSSDELEEMFSGAEVPALPVDPPKELTRVYIAGPMRGIKNFNFPAFMAAETALTLAGYKVFNPASMDMENGFLPIGYSGDEDDEDTRAWIREALAADLQVIASEVDAICLLDGWSESKGAKAELALAAAIGLEAGILSDFTDAPYGEADLLPAASFLDDRVVAYSDQVCDPCPENRDIETRVTSSTGGQKGQKLAQPSLIPPRALLKVAEVYGYGAKKYSPDNWRRGYDWRLSYDALQRHLNEFWSGVDDDPESGLPHLAHAAFHVFSLLEYGDIHPEFDDRPKR